MRKYIVFLIALMLGAVTSLWGKNETSEEWQMGHFMENWKFWSETHPSPITVNLPHDAMQTEKRGANVKGIIRDFFLVINIIMRRRS